MYRRVLLPYTQAKLELRLQAEGYSQAREQIDIIDLMLNCVSLVIYFVALQVNLGTNSAGLVVHLIASIGRVILVVPAIPALIAAVPLIVSYKGCGISTIAAAAVPLNTLIILLNADGLVLAADRVRAIHRTILIISPIYPLIPAISLIRANSLSPIATICDAMKGLTILLMAYLQRWSRKGSEDVRSSFRHMRDQCRGHDRRPHTQEKKQRTESAQKNKKETVFE